MSESVPKIFISYSWTSAERVIELAQRLMGDGVDVVLDKWELKEGQDKYAFMERSVTDESINKVLMICDKDYAEKANDRKGGVGDETMVISPEIYAKATETKYIPIIFERDDNDKEYVPAYLKSRIYIDLCLDNDHTEQEYEKLLRNLHDKPEHSKPALGKMPEWLNEESVDLSKVRGLLKQMQAYDEKNKNKVEFIVRKFNDEFINTLKSFAPKFDDNFDKNLLVQIDATKPLRDLFFDYVEAIMVSDLDMASVIGNFFEQVYNGTYHVAGRDAYNKAEFEFSQFLIWEMFIGSTAILLHYEKFTELNPILNRTYFLRKYPSDDNPTPFSFIEFKPYFQYVEEQIKPKSDKPNRCTMAGDIAVKRERLPITEKSLANADLVLYQLSCIYDFADELKPFNHYWFPTLYPFAVYAKYVHLPLWNKMVSRKHCEKLLPLFGVTDIEQLKIMVAKNQPNRDIRYPNCFFSAVSIRDIIKLEQIGTMP